MTKRVRKPLLCLLLAVTVAVAFWGGSVWQKQQHRSARLQQCRTLISFAVDKAENGSLADPEIAAALASNLYAAYQFCDESAAAGQLHELWNAMVFEPETFAGREALLAERLQTISAVLSTTK